jgi:hypothetical protein
MNFDAIKALFADNWKAGLIGAVATFIGLTVGAPDLTFDVAEGLSDADMRAKICADYEAEKDPTHD